MSLKYVGSKARIAKDIAYQILMRANGREKYIEPFIGGGSVFAIVGPCFRESYAGDIHFELIEMWKAIKNGWIPPSVVSELEYKELQKSKKFPPAYRGYVGFKCSYSAKWFGGYARGTTKDGINRNYAKEGVKEVLAIRPALKRAVIECKSYDKWSVDSNTVIYCDPPYDFTQGYSHYFDSDKFWKKADKWSKLGALVVVSEYEAPDNWKCIWEKTNTKSMLGYKPTIERLFICQF